MHLRRVRVRRHPSLAPPIKGGEKREKLTSREGLKSFGRHL